MKSKLLVMISIICICTFYINTVFAQQISEIKLQDVPPSFNRSSIVFSPDASRVIITAGMIGEEGKDATVWDTKTGEILFHLDHSEMLTGNYSGKPLQTRGYVDSAAFSSDGKYIITGAAPLIANLWDAQTGEKIRSYQLIKDKLSMASQTGFTAVGLSPDGNKLIASAIFPETHLWDVNTGDHLGLLFELGGAEEIFVKDDTDKILFVGERSFSSFTIDGKLIFEEKGDSPTISDDQSLVFLHLGTEGIKTFNIETGNLEFVNKNTPYPENHTDKLPAFDISPNGHYFTIGKMKSMTEKTLIYNLNIKSDEPLYEFSPAEYTEGNNLEPKEIVFSPNSKKMAIRYPEDVIIIYELGFLDSDIHNIEFYK